MIALDPAQTVARVHVQVAVGVDVLDVVDVLDLVKDHVEEDVTQLAPDHVILRVGVDVQDRVLLDVEDHVNMYADLIVHKDAEQNVLDRVAYHVVLDVQVDVIYHVLHSVLLLALDHVQDNVMELYPLCKMR